MKKYKLIAMLIPDGYPIPDFKGAKATEETPIFAVNAEVFLEKPEHGLHHIDRFVGESADKVITEDGPKEPYESP